MPETQNLDPRVVASHHPLYDQFVEEWRKLIHVREGTGGFADGTYLHAHPREWLDHSRRIKVENDQGATVWKTEVNPNPKKPSPKLLARRRLASYTNHAASILDTKKAGLFREAPVRRVGDAPSDEPTDLEDWWANVDGKGTSMDAFMPELWDLAATLGHVVTLFELPDETHELPFIRVYTPLDVLDWLENDDGDLTAVKLAEAVAPKEFRGTYVPQTQIRIVDEVGWRVYDQTKGKEGVLLKEGEHGLGTLPIVYLYGGRRSLVRHVGQSILGDPRLHIDLFNLESEERELFRNQTFSFINVPLGTGQDAISVEAAQQMLGAQTGTNNVIFSGLAAQILSADASNLASYREKIGSKQREIYRVAGAPWESDSRDAEAAQSLELKREELNVRLAQHADECEATEVAWSKLYYRHLYGPDSWEQKYDDDEVTIQYPDKFGSLPFEEVINQVTSAQSVGMPPLFMKALRKNIVQKFEGMGSLSPVELQEILDEIDAAPDDPTPQERMRQRMELMDAAVKAGGKPPSVPPDVSKE